MDDTEEYLPILEFMLEHKADIEAKDDNGMFLTYSAIVMLSVHSYEVTRATIRIWPIAGDERDNP
eukprot:CAMPEP_0197534492 /NCGR_PEP_ID=MMETSP1318-20131121/47341_1 /TAXON_ID=552666 /ORGANISM="Partenskyella glossopodia, Strain RCC365" /LENGTH=64 /DNA_ID=CAMNT_0043091787 /DNA_START=84 /DNA_END=278 /DNA_ORIENTATION=+